MHYSAKRDTEVACRPSVCPSVCDVGGSGPHRLGILEPNCTNNSPNTFALRIPKAICLLPGEHGETRGGVEKSGVLEHKISGNVSEMRKDRGKVTMENLQELINALSNSTIPTPYRLLFPNFWDSHSSPKTPIAIIYEGTGEATDFKFGRYIHRVHPNQSPLKILEKRERGRIQGLPKSFKVPPIISGTGKATDFKFCTHIQRIDCNKSPLKFREK